MFHKKLYYSPTLEKRNLNQPPPHLYPNHHAPDGFFPSNFFYLKKSDNAQLCTGKIRAIHSNNIENRPCIIKQTIINKN